MQVFKIIILFLLSVSLFAFENKQITFAPLPMKNKKKTIEEFLPLINHLKKVHRLNIVYKYEVNYQGIIDGFQDKTIDIAYLGPLPFAMLKSQYPHVKPIITFPQKNGETFYRCVISKFHDDVEPTQRLYRVALTQPLSTCGYYMTQKLFKQYYNKELESQQYHYTMSHTNALLETLKGHYDVAGASEAISEKFTSLGMKILARSQKMPGFSLVVNTKTLSSVQIEFIQKQILKISKKEYKQWGNKLMYGFERADATLYDAVKIDKHIPHVGNLK